MDTVTDDLLTKGAFGLSLVRDNKDIKRDRAVSIAEDLEISYRRAVENLQVDIKRKKRELEGMLDLSPTNTQSLVLAVDFDANAFVEKNISLGVQIRQLEIKLEVASEKYKHLFGKEIA